MVEANNQWLEKPLPDGMALTQTQLALTAMVYHIILGSNLGDRVAQLRNARSLLTERAGTIKFESRLYETQPWGFEDQPWFLNQAIALISEKEPLDLLASLRREHFDRHQPAIVLTAEAVEESDPLIAHNVPH